MPMIIHAVRQRRPSETYGKIRARLIEFCDRKPKQTKAISLRLFHFFFQVIDECLR
jgi:hypothetical protein